MSVSFRDEVDWARPWYASVRSAAMRMAGHDDWLGAINRLAASTRLVNHRGLPMSFVEQSALPAEHAYESFISATGRVPTRDNAHDFFNAMVWLGFPGIKRQLNALQAAQIERAGVGESRGATRDAATIFDENAALLVVSDTGQGRALAEALRAHRWRDAFVEQRDSFGRHAEVWSFGHALMEKLMTPYKAITAHAWVVVTAQDFFLAPPDARREWLDAHVASALEAGLAGRAGALNTAHFTPLPVLGIPGWWSSQDAAFYEDAHVFRPRRRGQV